MMAAKSSNIDCEDDLLLSFLAKGLDHLVHLSEVCDFGSDIGGSRDTNDDGGVGESPQVLLYLIKSEAAFRVCCQNLNVIIKLNPRKNVRMVLVGSEKNRRFFRILFLQRCQYPD